MELTTSKRSPSRLPALMNGSMTKILFVTLILTLFASSVRSFALLPRRLTNNSHAISIITMCNDDNEKARARERVKADLDRRGSILFAVIIAINARFTFMPQEIRSICKYLLLIQYSI